MKISEYDPIVKSLEKPTRRKHHALSVAKPPDGPNFSIKHGAPAGYEYLPSSMAIGHFPQDYTTVGVHRDKLEEVAINRYFQDKLVKLA